MTPLVKTVGFSLFLIATFALVANLLPQVEGEAPTESSVDIGALTPEVFVQLGKSLFSGKGTCSLCHNNLGRAPNILEENLVRTARQRIADERYEGTATDAESYIRESMLTPSVFIVKGFGKKGSNDTISPMPDIRKAPIELSDIEISAIIAFLEAKDGNPVTVALPTAEQQDSAGSNGADSEDEENGPAETAAAAIEKFGCAACHAVMDSTADVGPDLTSVGKRLSAAEIRQSIVDPAAVIAKGYENMMPDFFAEEMYVKELDLIVDYLAAQGNKQK